MDSSAQQWFTVAQVAGQLDVQVWTVRRWADYHAAHLTPQTPGQPRRFNTADVNTLREVSQQRAAGRTAAQVNEWLETVKFGQVDSTEPPHIAPAPHGEELAPIVAQIDLATLTAPFAARLDAIERRQAADNAARRHWLVAFALGVLSMGVLILIILLLYWLGA